MFPYIFYRELHATPWEIVIFITLNPVAALLSLYWGAFVDKRPDRLKSNIMWAGVVGHLPFLLAPWIDNCWYYILASTVYMLTTRGVIPAWMEVLKLHIPHVSRHSLFAYASTLSYVGSALFPCFFGWLMDDFHDMWRWIFVASALFSLGGIMLQAQIPSVESQEVDAKRAFTMSHWLLHPWKNVYQLLTSRPDFVRFQLAFMLGGAGLMVIKPVIPGYFTEVLHLSYTELGVALALCKGVGYALTSQTWARWFGKTNIYRFLTLVTFIACLFPLGLLMSQYSLSLFYAAWIGYGVMQAGSEMGWKMSGMAFSGNQDSTLFTTVNVLAVGIRGCIVPPLGGFLATQGYVVEALFLGSLLSLLSACYSFVCYRREEAVVPLKD
jgi:MFS family permease